MTETTTAVEVHTKLGQLAGQEAQDFRKGIEEFSPAFQAALGDAIPVGHFIEVATTTYLDPKNRLQKCEPMSVVRALLRSAQLKLRPDGKEGAIIPRGREANFEPMFQGIVRLMLRTGTVKKVESHVVKHGDAFDYGFGLDPFLTHRPASSNDQGGVEYAYAVVWLANGERQFEVVDRDELDKIKRLTKEGNNGKLGPAWQNYPEEMQRKIAVKRLSKYIEQTPELAAVIDYDNEIQSGGMPDPRDYLPELEDRTIEERARQRADSRTDELRRAAMAGNGEPETVEATVVEDPPVEDVQEEEDDVNLDVALTFGKYKGRTIRELLDEGGRSRGYVTHWMLTDSCQRLDGDQKTALGHLVALYDEGNADGEDDPQGQGEDGQPTESDATPQGPQNGNGNGEGAPPPPPALWPEDG